MQHSTFVSSRDHRSLALLLVLGGVGVAGLAVDPAEAALMNYTLDGGNSTISPGGNSTISGSVGGTSFTNESWTMTATADSNQVQSGTVNDGTTPAGAYFLPTTVTLWIGGTSSPVATVTMSNYTSGSSSFVWGVFSADYSSVFGPAAGGAGFGPLDLSTTPNWTGGAGAAAIASGALGGPLWIFNDLSYSEVWSAWGTFFLDSSVTYQTSGGLLVLTDVSGDGSNGTWTIANASAVPGGGVAVLLAAGAVRRRRR
jgi:hypothetical protein